MSLTSSTLHSECSTQQGNAHGSHTAEASGNGVGLEARLEVGDNMKEGSASTEGDRLAESEIEERFFTDGRRIDVGNGGDVMLTFDLGNGQQWRKRVWPRKGYPTKLLRWNSVEEILSYLISFDRQDEWISTEVPLKSPSGSILFFDRSKTKKYRSDGYDWKTRRTMSNTVREDRMKLKVGGYQLVYGCYAHSASDPDFHRRTYWLIQNPNLIMVHYLDCCEYNTASAKELEPLNLEPYLTPTDWSLLAISDCNLCALLDKTKTADATKVLLSQLPLILGSNFHRSATLEEVLATNNAGLPVNMFRDSRSKKAMSMKNTNTTPTKETSILEDLNLQLESDTPCKGVSNGYTTSSSPTSPTPNQAEVLKVLSKSPHIVMCYPKDGSVSYILTLPMDAAQNPPLPGIPVLKKHSSPSDPSVQNGLVGVEDIRTDQQAKKVLLKGKRKQGVSKKGKNKATSEEQNDLLISLQQMLNGLIKPIDQEPEEGNGTSTLESTTHPTVTPPSFIPPNPMSSTTLSTATPSISIPSSSSSELKITVQQSGSQVGDGETGSMDLPEVPLSWLFPVQDDFSPGGTTMVQDLPSSVNHPTSGYNSEEMYPELHPFINSNLTLNDSGGIGVSDMGGSLMETSADGNFDLDINSENWQQLLQCPFNSPIIQSDDNNPTSLEHNQTSSNSGDGHRINMASPNMDVCTQPPSLSSTETQVIPQVLVSEAHSDSWNQSWQSADPHSKIQLGLQTGNTSVLATQAAATGNLSTLTSSPANLKPSNPSPVTLPPDLHDFIFQSTSTTVTTSSSSLPPPLQYDLIHEKDSNFLSLSPRSHTTSHSITSTPLSSISSNSLHFLQQPGSEEGASRKISDASIHSEPLLEWERSNSISSPSCSYTPEQDQFQQLLPSLTDGDAAFPDFMTMTESDNCFMETSGNSTRSPGGVRPNTPNFHTSPSLLQNIPKGIQMGLGSMMENPMNSLGYRTNSPIPSSPSAASVSSSSLSVQDMFEESPSVRELCEMLSESSNMQQTDFSNMTLTDSEQDQLFHAAEIIQGAFRKYKVRRQLRNKEKNAALLIEKYYRRYREAKEQKDQAARRIQQQYRIYKRRARELKELSRAATFIQQMYRFQRTRRPLTHPYQRHPHSDSS